MLTNHHRVLLWTNQCDIPKGGSMGWFHTCSQATRPGPSLACFGPGLGLDFRLESPKNPEKWIKYYFLLWKELKIIVLNQKFNFWISQTKLGPTHSRPDFSGPVQSQLDVWTGLVPLPHRDAPMQLVRQQQRSIIPTNESLGDWRIAHSRYSQARMTREWGGTETFDSIPFSSSASA